METNLQEHNQSICKREYYSRKRLTHGFDFFLRIMQKSFCYGIYSVWCRHLFGTSAEVAEEWPKAFNLFPITERKSFYSSSAVDHLKKHKFKKWEH